MIFSFNAAAMVSTATSKVMLDRAYPAMAGPTKGVILPVQLPNESSELWVTGVKIEMPSKYLCHSRLGLARVDGLDPDSLKMGGREEDSHNRKYDIEWFLGNSQGNLENKMPDGYGIKLNTKFIRQPVYTVQLQREDHTKKTETAEIKISLEYFDAEEAEKKNLKPLFGQAFPIVEKGRRHWTVPVGRHLYKTGVKFFSEGRENFKVHYIQTHAHAYADWVELFDLTEGKSVWRGKGITDEKSGTLASIEVFSSVEGVEIKTSHKYEVRSEYNNFSKKPVDAMILMKLYSDAPSTNFIASPFSRKGEHSHH